LSGLDRLGDQRISPVSADYYLCPFFDFGTGAVVTANARDPAIGPDEPGDCKSFPYFRAGFPGRIYKNFVENRSARHADRLNTVAREDIKGQPEGT
jgi:hypothetical protein